MENGSGSSPLAEARKRTMASLGLAGGVFVTAILTFAIGIVTGVRGTELLMLGIALITTMVAFIPAIIDRARPQERRQLLISFFSLIYLIYFAIPVLTEYLWIESDWVPGGVTRLKNVAPPDIVYAQLGALVGLIFLLIGFALPAGRVVGNALPHPRREWHYQPALMAALVMVPLGWVILLGGQFGFIPRRAGSGALGTIASSIYFGFALLTVIYLRYRSTAAAGLIMLLLPPTMAITFFTGSKKFFLAPLAMIAMSYIVTTRRVALSWIAGGIVAISLIYPVAQFYREYVQRGNPLSFAQVLRDPSRALNSLSAFVTQVDASDYLFSGIRATSSRLSALGILSVVMRETPERVPYQHGRTISLAFIAWIPRIVWPGKPETSIGRWVTEHYSATPGSTSSTGPSWIGELYFNFGWAGIVLGMLFLGVYFRVLQELFFSPGIPIPAVVAGVAVLWATLPKVQGALTSPLNGVPFLMIPILLAHIVMRIIGGTYRPDRGEENRGPTAARAEPTYST